MPDPKSPTPPLKALLPLFVAGTLGRLPAVTLPIASLLLVADRSNLTRGGLASGAVSLGAGGIGVFVGRHLDSQRAARVLMLLTVVHIPAVAAFIALASTHNGVLLAAVGFVAGASVPPVGPVVRALLAQRTERENIQRVFAYDSMAVEVTWIGGPLLVSGAILIGGPSLAVALSPLLAAIGVVAVSRQPARGTTHLEMTGRWLTRPVLQLVLAFALAGTAFRAVTIAVTEVARQHGHDEWSGALIAFWAIGSLLGGWVAARRGLPSLPLLGTGLAISIGLIGIGHSSIWLTGILAFISGVPTAPFVSGLNALVSRVAAEAAHARAFAAMQAASTVMAAVGAAAGGAAIDRWGPAAVSIPSAAFLLGAAALSVVGEPTPTAQPAAALSVMSDAALAGGIGSGLCANDTTSAANAFTPANTRNGKA